jgi:hypothetical protein
MKKTCTMHARYMRNTWRVHKQIFKVHGRTQQVHSKYMKTAQTSYSQGARVPVTGKSSVYCNDLSDLQRFRRTAGLPFGPFPRQSAISWTDPVNPKIWLKQNRTPNRRITLPAGPNMNWFKNLRNFSSVLCCATRGASALPRQNAW